MHYAIINSPLLTLCHSSLLSVRSLSIYLYDDNDDDDYYYLFTNKRDLRDADRSF